MVGSLSLSSMVTVAATPPTVITMVSSDASMVSLVVGTVTIKLLTAAATVILLPLRVTPLLKAGVLVKSVPAAVSPAKVKLNVVAIADLLMSATV